VAVVDFVVAAAEHSVGAEPVGQLVGAAFA
jgi:hypothetical protein